MDGHIPAMVEVAMGALWTGLARLYLVRATLYEERPLGWEDERKRIKSRIEMYKALLVPHKESAVHALGSG